ncbi:sporulation histidine kinase inhibitor Sda [Salsuginibacillus kocurii]|nr:sporulation histidine kinase inhibitor Sda [Salsuginibacillus kocurii]
MKQLTDDLLIEAYEEAINLRLNKEFIKLLELEMEKRSLSVPMMASSF